ncbi:MAG: hexose kinase [Clostridia bacterium]|nr:hexose kinase [Clostridia bacterium]
MSIREKIITLTVNPAIDLHIDAPSFAAGCDNPARVLSRDMGGKGINVSRALLAYGIDNLAAAVFGRENREAFTSSRDLCGMRLLFREVAGFIRENINIHSRDTETVIATEGPAVSAEVINSLGEDILARLLPGSYLVFSGRISEGSDRAAVMELLRSVREAGVRLVLDSKSITKEDISALRPYLIKPNLDEAEELLGRKIRGREDYAAALGALSSLGAECVLLTLGGEGGALLLDGETYIAEAPAVTVRSTVGAGDSTVAGFIAGDILGVPRERRLALAMAFGSAACMTAGTGAPDPCEIKELFSKIKPKKM